MIASGVSLPILRDSLHHTAPQSCLCDRSVSLGDGPSWQRDGGGQNG
ncbi:MAG: hypothetical protein HC890_11345 [Chloroflexaceae bacterium]|nr:hypothetical protein [Chloroflexaceae bacterium]